MDNMEWVDRNNESRLLRNQVAVGLVMQRECENWWWWFHKVVGGKWGRVETRAEAKAAVEKEVGE